MASLKRKQTLFSGVARKAKEIRQNSTNLAFDNKTNARKGSKIATADARLAIYVFYLSMPLPPTATLRTSLCEKGVIQNFDVSDGK